MLTGRCREGNLCMCFWLVMVGMQLGHAAHAPWAFFSAFFLLNHLTLQLIENGGRKSGRGWLASERHTVGCLPHFPYESIPCFFAVFFERSKKNMCNFLFSCY